VLTFSFSMLEVSDSLMLAQRPADYPIAKEIFSQANAGTADALHLAAAMGVYAMGLLAATMAAATLLLGKRLGAIFRV
jgi:iron(III) transport system permease protein